MTEKRSYGEKAKVAIIYPSYAAFSASKRIKSWDATFTHHGIASIIAYANKDGLKIDFIDLRRLRNWKEFQEVAKGYNYLCLSIVYSDYTTANLCIEKIKEVNNKAIIIVGGIHPTVRPSDFLNDSRINYIITGEGEISLVNLIKVLEQGGEHPRLIEGIKIDLNEIPYIDRELWPPEEQIIFGLEIPFFTLISSRACFKNCRFCQPCVRMVFGNKTRMRSVEHVIGELKQLKEKYGMKSFFLLDDNVLQDPKWITQFISAYTQHKIDAEFVLVASVDYICKKPEIISKLSEIGCRWFAVGFESGSQRVLDYLRKNTTIEQNEKAVEVLRTNGIKIFASIMFGIPTETEEESWETVKFVRKMEPEWFSPSFYTPYPGNELAKECEESGLIIPYADTKELARGPGKPRIKGIDYRSVFERLLICQVDRDITLRKAIRVKIESYRRYFCVKCSDCIPSPLRTAFNVICYLLKKLFAENLFISELY